MRLVSDGGYRRGSLILRRIEVAQQLVQSLGKRHFGARVCTADRGDGVWRSTGGAAESEINPSGV